MWDSKSKYDLIIEVWEKLDCESVGRTEIEAIETVINENFGKSPTDTPMRLARLLADEGAELRHSEILELDVQRRTSEPGLPLLSKPLELGDKSTAVKTIRELERIRLKLSDRADKEHLSMLRRKVMKARDECKRVSDSASKTTQARTDALEIAEWLTLWLQSPEIFKSWFDARYPEKSTD
ncbi:MAG: hypothetical protein HKN33_02715 [Pyrinomonadaceae bacterium]|nr:hypothetical protein [Pyrinomonadaceae bacterium]